MITKHFLLVVLCIICVTISYVAAQEDVQRQPLGFLAGLRQSFAEQLNKIANIGNSVFAPPQNNNTNTKIENYVDEDDDDSEPTQDVLQGINVPEHNKKQEEKQAVEQAPIVVDEPKQEIADIVVDEPKQQDAVGVEQPAVIVDEPKQEETPAVGVEQPADVIVDEPKQEVADIVKEPTVAVDVEQAPSVVVDEPKQEDAAVDEPKEEQLVVIEQAPTTAIVADDQNEVIAIDDVPIPSLPQFAEYADVSQQVQNQVTALREKLEGLIGSTVERLALLVQLQELKKQQQAEMLKQRQQEQEEGNNNNNNNNTESIVNLIDQQQALLDEQGNITGDRANDTDLIGYDPSTPREEEQQEVVVDTTEEQKENNNEQEQQQENTNVTNTVLIDEKFVPTSVYGERAAAYGGDNYHYGNKKEKEEQQHNSNLLPIVDETTTTTTTTTTTSPQQDNTNVVIKVDGDDTEVSTSQCNDDNKCEDGTIKFIGYKDYLLGGIELCSTCEMIYNTLWQEQQIFSTAHSKGCITDNDCTYVYLKNNLRQDCTTAVNKQHLDVYNTWNDYYNNRFAEGSNELLQYIRNCGRLTSMCLTPTAIKCQNNICIQSWEQLDDNNDTKIPEVLFIAGGDIGDKPIELVALPEQRIPSPTPVVVEEQAAPVVEETTTPTTEQQTTLPTTPTTEQQQVEAPAVVGTTVDAIRVDIDPL